jgi:hypothetical protein
MGPSVADNVGMSPAQDALTGARLEKADLGVCQGADPAARMISPEALYLTQYRGPERMSLRQVK